MINREHWKWNILLGEVKIVDQKTDRQYTLIVGYLDDRDDRDDRANTDLDYQGLYIRLWDPNDVFVAGSWVLLIEHNIDDSYFGSVPKHVLDKCLEAARRL